MISETPGFLDRLKRVRLRTWVLLGLACALALGVFGARASVATARAWSSRASALRWTVKQGPAEQPLPAPAGPYDIRLGYTRLPEFVEIATEAGFVVERQAEPNEVLRRFVGENGYTPPYAEKGRAGLTLTDWRGRTLMSRQFPAHSFAAFDSIPPTLVRTLLWVEDRELLKEGAPSRNPALDWDRLAKAFLELGLSTVDRDRKVPGGSTLATQIEKFRHSPGGRTTGLAEKWRQIVSASVRAYRTGPSTLEARQTIVLDYLNSVPLAAHPRSGEVLGIGEALAAWFGVDPRRVMDALWSLEARAPGRAVSREEAIAYRQVLSLILSQRRPSFYLSSPEGPARLADLAEQHLRRFREEGVVSRELAREAIQQRVVPAPAAVPVRANTWPGHEGSPAERKAITGMRARLTSLLGVEGVYVADRLDLRARVTLDSLGQAAAGSLVHELQDTAVVRTRGLRQSGLLARGNPARVRYSILVLESTPEGNAVRIDVDNDPGASSLTAAGRLELGSTAKLRTLVTYLETVDALFDRLRRMDVDSVGRLSVHPRDRMTAWVAQQLTERPDISRAGILERAMDRRFSADPGERFPTGGGVQNFRNFDSRLDQARPTVRLAFQQSTNLVFVRMLRDVVDHGIFAPWSPTSQVLASPDSVRRPYLMAFAQSETRTFIRRFHRKYSGIPSVDVPARLLENRRGRPRGAAWALKWVVPEIDSVSFASAMRGEAPAELPRGTNLFDLFRRTDSQSQSLLDVAYLSSVHPLELWVARYLRENEGATLEQTLAEGALLAEEVYGWLLNKAGRSRQDSRIYSILEMEAFNEILVGWRRLGYPYQNLVPSLGTSIGSSGDRPEALADLVGILVNDGMRRPTVRVTELEFARATPYEVSLKKRDQAGERVMRSEVARTVRDAMVDVVANGTARRARGALSDTTGTPLIIGAKTGTGDNRLRASSMAGDPGRVVNRTSTLVFFAGERYFGVITAYVPGEDAGTFSFTSALASQVLAELGKQWRPDGGEG